MVIKDQGEFSAVDGNELPGSEHLPVAVHLTAFIKFQVKNLKILMFPETKNRIEAVASVISGQGRKLMLVGTGKWPRSAGSKSGNRNFQGLMPVCRR